MSKRSPGEGSIFQRKDGRWQASLMVNGIRRTAYGKSKAKARRKLTALKREAYSLGGLADPGRRTVNDLLDRWLEVEAPNWKPRTLADYRGVADLYIRPAIGKARLSRLDPVQIQAIYARLQGEGKHRAALKVHSVLHRAFKVGTLWRWLAENPCDRVLRPTYRPPRKELWTPEELAVFLEGMEEHWLQPLWIVALATGCRLGELLALSWEDVSLPAGTITVQRTLQRIKGEWVFSTPKTAAGERTIALPQEGVDALRRQRVQWAKWRLRAGPTWEDWGLVFTGRTGKPLHGSVVSHALKRECERLGLPGLTPHGLRHLHASLLLGEGLPVPAVSRRLGHANPSITLAVYAHALKGQDGEAAQAIGKTLSLGHLEAR